LRIVNVTLSEIQSKTLDIGYAGEKNHVRVIIYCTSFFNLYPNASASMVAKPPVGDMYPVVLEKVGKTLVWNVSEADIANPGGGDFQITFTQNDEVIKTAIGHYNISASMVASGDPPTPLEDWIEQAQAVLDDIEEYEEIIDAGGIIVETISDTSPEIIGERNHRYVCGEVEEISIVPPSEGIMDVVFTSGTIPADLTIPSTVLMPEWFDSTALDADTIYEINIMDGIYGVVAMWGVSE